jgi:hypothetical protein
VQITARLAREDSGFPAKGQPVSSWILEEKIGFLYQQTPHFARMARTPKQVNLNAEFREAPRGEN